MRLEQFTDEQLRAELAWRGHHHGTIPGAVEHEPSPRDWHPSEASLAWWAAHGPGRAELKVDEWDAHDLVSRHLLECERCRGEVGRLRLRSADMKANTITKHREHWVLTGDGPEVAEFGTKDELLAIPWVAEYASRPGFHRFSLDAHGHYLLAERDGGQGWWVVGRLGRADGVDLPRRAKGEGR